MTKKTIIYIAGLSHCGSTILDFILSKNADAIGLGEIFSVLQGRGRTMYESDVDEICSCGQALDECDIWKNFAEIRTSQDNYKHKYLKLLKSNSLKNKRFIIDSSKKTWPLTALKELDAEGEIDLKVIFLVRDIRAWTYSNLKRVHSRKLMSFLPIPRLFRSWKKNNQEIENFLIKNKISYTRVYFDEVVLNVNKNVVFFNKEFFESKNSFVFYNQKLPNSHIAGGNPSKLRDGLNTVSYDYSWFFSYKISLWITLLPVYFYYNQKVKKAFKNNKN